MELNMQIVLTMISALAAVTLATITIFTMRASRAMACQMYESRMAQFRPLLYPVLRVYGLEQRRAPDILLRNIGPGTAMNIDLLCRGTETCSNHIAFFGPGDKEEIPVRNWYHAEGGSQDLELEVRFRDIFNNPIGVKATYSFELACVGKEQLVYPTDTQLDGYITCDKLHL